MVSAFIFGLATLGITYQDFKHRAIHIALLLLLFGVSVVDAFWSRRPFAELLQTLVFTLVVLGLMCLYLRLRYGSWVNPLTNHLGLGDVLFFVAVIPLFNTHGFVWFFISGLLFCVVVYSLLKSQIGKDSIPLAGMLAVYLLGLKIIESQGGFSMFNLYL